MCVDSSESVLTKGEVYEVEGLIRGIEGEYYIHLKDVHSPFAFHPERLRYAWSDTKLGELL